MYQLSVYIHVVAAIVWVGGMLFLPLVITPVARQLRPDDRSALFSAVGQRFRPVGWICIAILVISGIGNVVSRGFRLDALATSELGVMLLIKVAIVVVMIAISAIHDFVIGPASVRVAKGGGATSPEAARLRRRAALFGRINAVLALIVVALGVLVARGLP